MAVPAYIGGMAMETEACGREDGEWFKGVEVEGSVEMEVLVYGFKQREWS